MIEIMASVGIAAVVMVTITNLNFQTNHFNQRNMSTLRAVMYAQEGIEAVKDMELTNAGWSRITGITCSSSSVCKIVLTGSPANWQLLAGVETLETLFTRSVWIEQVCRDVSSFPNTVVTGSCPSVDVNTKKVVTTVAWTDSDGVHTEKLEAFVYHII